MKKLFFAALVAVAAVGGAYAIPVFDASGTKIGDCDPTPQTIDCATVNDTTPLYRSTLGSAEAPYSDVELSDLQYQPD